VKLSFSTIVFRTVRVLCVLSLILGGVGVWLSNSPLILTALIGLAAPLLIVAVLYRFGIVHDPATEERI
jgi:hypothetical protein